MSDEELIARLRDEEHLPQRQVRGACFQAAARIEQLAETNEALVKDKRWIMEERDRTFALMLARAERLEAALRMIEATTTPPVPIPWTHSVAADTYWQIIDRMKFTARAALKGNDHE